MAARYVVRLMFEWRGGSLWSGNENARERFGVGSIEDRLPLSDTTRRRLRAMSVRHDKSLNWEYPPDPGPWTKEMYEQFDVAARNELALLQLELGPEFEVSYEPL